MKRPLLIGLTWLCVSSSLRGQVQCLWRQSLLPDTSHAYSFIDFSDSLHGFLFDRDGHYLYTTNGGDTWKVDSFNLDGSVREIDFLGPECLWIVTEVPYRSHLLLHRTTDMGLTWYDTQIPDSLMLDVRRLSFVGRDHLIGTYADFNGHIFAVLKSSDAGTTWTSSPLGNSLWAWSSNFTDTLHGTVAYGGQGPPTAGGYLLTTFDGGATWDTTQNWDDSFGFVHYFTPLLGFCTGYRLFIVDDVQYLHVFTTDGGRSWTYGDNSLIKAGVRFGSGLTIQFRDYDRMTLSAQDSLYYVRSFGSGDTILALEALSEQSAWLLCSSHHLYFKTDLVTGVHSFGQSRSQPSEEAITVFPNPFNSTSTITYVVRHDGPVRLTVFNLMGQAVATLVRNERSEAGVKHVRWDAGSLPTGMYIIELLSGRTRDVTKALLIR